MGEVLELDDSFADVDEVLSLPRAPKRFRRGGLLRLTVVDVESSSFVSLDLLAAGGVSGGDDLTMVGSLESLITVTSSSSGIVEPLTESLFGSSSLGSVW